MPFNVDEYPDPPPYDTGQLAVTGVCALIEVMAVIVNGALLIIIARDPVIRRQRSVSLLVNLVVADFGLGLLIAPLTLTHWIAGEFSTNQFGCAWYGFHTLFWSHSSAMALVLISVERYLVVVRRYQLSNNALHGIICALWVYSALIAACPFMGFGYYRIQSSELLCELGYWKRDGDELSLVLILILSYFVAMNGISFCYLRIFKHVQAHSYKPHTKVAHRRVAPEASAGTATAFTSNGSSGNSPVPRSQTGLGTKLAASNGSANGIGPRPSAFMHPIHPPSSAAPALVRISSDPATAHAPTSNDADRSHSVSRVVTEKPATPPVASPPSPAVRPQRTLTIQVRAAPAPIDLTVLGSPTGNGPTSPLTSDSVTGAGSANGSLLALHPKILPSSPGSGGAAPPRPGSANQPSAVPATAIPISPTNAGSGLSAAAERHRNHELAVGRKTFVLVLVFAVCWLPMGLKILWELIGGTPAPAALDDIAMTLVGSNSLWNPFVLLYVNDRMKELVRRQMPFCFAGGVGGGKKHPPLRLNSVLPPSVLPQSVLPASALPSLNM